MNSLSAFNSAIAAGHTLSRGLNTLPSTSSSVAAPATKSSALQQRVDDLSSATLQMADDLIGKFAKQLFGDQAQGMKIEFDTLSLSAESSFSAMQQSTQSAEQSRQVSAFRLSDASHFNGKGTLTTADGRRFEIEVDIRYEAKVEGMGISQQSLLNNSQQDIPTDSRHKEPAKSPAAITADTSDLSRPSINSYFAGTAADLLQRLTSEPVFQPFSLLQQADPAQRSLLGDWSLQVLNLAGGPRYLDLSPHFDRDKTAFEAQA
ncbi:hypothetical protein [Deefgea sp. CFH1-16]|uniref:hypothetical protein n=1 Tax=Deefgea sp. CFH1-16 TaxID=2675457 RepID=UPI0015F599BD|nr:hypothetical protein [Deefgea sp. CFH1-16]MBM5574327.1 hypothetical protein [Deefgea sp. CFH1-16]